MVHVHLAHDRRRVLCKVVFLFFQLNECYLPLGVDSFAEDVDDLPDYLNPCIENTTLLLSEEEVSRTRIFLGATAGMRLLKLQNPNQADGIMTK